MMMREEPTTSPVSSTGSVAALIERVSDMITVIDATGRISYQSAASHFVLGYEPEEMVGQEVLTLVHPEEQERLRRFFDEAASTEPGLLAPIEFRVRHRDGSWRYLEVAANNLLADPSMRGLVAVSRDITHRVEREQELRRQALFDALTGLPNRALYMDRLVQACASSARRSDGIAVLFLDLDGFKVINDSLGHAAGDVLLRAVGERLTASLRPGDTVSRFGGDEFTILLEDIKVPADAFGVARRALDELHTPFIIEGREVYVTASIGVALRMFPGPVSQPEELLREADIALYQAKGAGKACAVVFEPEMTTGVIDRLDLGDELRRAVERGELRLHYQPEVNLETGIITGVEALVRWQHPRRGLLGPGDFLPLAEEMGLIVPIGQWVLQEACRQAREWEDLRREGPPLILSINLSARQFQQPDLAGQIADILEETGLDAAHVRLEIAESALVDGDASTEDTLRELQDLGVRLTIDDFGAGVSSLGSLRRFPVDTLKVDREYVRALEHDEGAVAIVRAVTALGRAIGIEVTAQGMETANDLALVRAAGLERGQGYFFAHPVPGDAMSALLVTGLPRRTSGEPSAA
jgi:diguanylate cyclase (GGDEF)-like protein/PAS domain S-box-containing protein